MNKPPRCFICKNIYTERHSFYPGLCCQCGEFNYDKRHQRANLQGLTAVITGTRIKIGYAVTLKLLRDGATVIATTRFPHDAAQRYAQETDFQSFQNRLHIYGLDLRHLASVEAFTAHIRNCYSQLDIIINNAAQTIRRPPAYYQQLIEFEALAFSDLPSEIQPLLRQNHVFIQGNSSQLLSSGTENNNSLIPIPNLNSQVSSALLSQIPLLLGDEDNNNELFPTHKYTEDGEPMDLRPFNSWLMKDDEVPIIELLEVQIINAIAPFIINSRLKQLMHKHPDNQKYIINVSSMEGRFNNVDKSWRHPHTNMAKAAFNMMTFTCAKEYAKHGIFMNAVDPGWISLLHPYPQTEAMRSRGVKPMFDCIDAAARICDPIYTSLNTGINRFGKFYKDYVEMPW